LSEKPHKKLKVWQEAIVLTEMVYKVTSSYPREEKFGLVSQMRRSAVSVASNIAEGAARYNNKEKIQFFLIARGSISELDTQLEICKRLNFLSPDDSIFKKVEEVSVLLYGLIESRRRKL
jgi:four helix bundle protein